jgi:hypothetical protein
MLLREREQTEGLGGLESEEYSDLLNKEIAFEEFYDKSSRGLSRLRQKSQVERTTERFCLRCRVADHQLKI